MSTIIMDLCSYTRLGLTGYLLSRGVKKREINDIETVDDLAIACDSQRPSVVFINEDCFIHDASKEGANKRGNTSRLTQSFHFFMFEPIFSPVNALNQPI
ncbi:colanic acid capsular biosynthesis activation protein A [Escherichia coli KOEGE 7 (16a)]|nr:colanic acid capsular biosynthesis activation protein A [Escherichia coli KOEGE 7 (16a)]